MSITMVSLRSSWPGRPGRMARWVGLGLLLAAEVIALSLRFHVPALPAVAPWWAWPLARARDLWIPGLLAAGIMAALGGARSFRGDSGVTGRSRGHFPALVAAHLTALAGFVAVTLRVFEGDVFAARWPAAWVVGWYLAGGAVLTTWLLACHPAGGRGIGRDELGIVALGLAGGVGAVAASQWAGQLWLPMAGATLVVVQAMLGLVASNVVADPTTYQLGVDGFTVQIAPTCSGYEGIGLVWMFLAVYLLGSRRSLRWPAAWLLIPLGTLAIWLVNAARIAALILIGAWASPEVAVGGFHSQAGSLGILTISLGLVVVSRRARFFATQPVREDADATVEANPTAAYLVPFLAVLATTMLTGALTAGFDALYPLRICAGVATLWFFRRSLPARLGDGSWLAVGAGVVVFGLWVALEPRNPAGSAALRAGFERLPLAWGWVWLASRVLGSVGIIPLVEELAFRGYLSRRLIAADFDAVPLGRFTWLSFLLSSTAFGLLHGRWFAGILAGLIYGGVYYRRGRVGEAALAHAVTNGLIALTVLVTGDATLWS